MKDACVALNKYMHSIHTRGAEGPHNSRSTLAPFVTSIPYCPNPTGGGRKSITKHYCTRGKPFKNRWLKASGGTCLCFYLFVFDAPLLSKNKKKTYVIDVQINAVHPFYKTYCCTTDIPENEDSRIKVMGN